MNIWSRRLFNIPHYLSGSGTGTSGEGWNGIEGVGYFPTPDNPLPDYFDEDQGIELLPSNPVYSPEDADTTITRTLTVTDTSKLYYATLVGGGGNGNTITGSVTPYSRYSYAVAGGSGACWRGLVRLYQGEYTAVRGKRGESSRLFGTGLNIEAGAGGSCPSSFGSLGSYDSAGGNVTITDDTNIVDDYTNSQGINLYPPISVSGNVGHYNTCNKRDTGYAECMANIHGYGGVSVYGGAGAGGISYGGYAKGGSGGLQLIALDTFASYGYYWDYERQDFYFMAVNETQTGLIKIYTHSYWMQYL